jgi:hypothetical protein
MTHRIVSSGSRLTGPEPALACQKCHQHLTNLLRRENVVVPSAEVFCAAAPTHHGPVGMTPGYVWLSHHICSNLCSSKREFWLTGDTPLNKFGSPPKGQTDVLAP